MSHAVTLPPEAVVTAIVEDGSNELDDTGKVYSYLITHTIFAIMHVCMTYQQELNWKLAYVGRALQ